MSGTAKVRRARHLVSYWSDEGMVITNYAMRSSVVADALVHHVLNLCNDWTSIKALGQQLQGVPPRAVGALAKSMLEQHLLVQAGDRAERRERLVDAWSDWNPEAGLFHFSTKDIPAPVNREGAEHALRAEAKAGKLPAPIKRYPGATSIPLPAPRIDGEFPRVLLDRRTWRSFGTSALTLADVSTLLNLTWGVQKTAQSPGLGQVFLKTSPSSGARQPLESYLLAVAVEGLEPGLYHYRADQHVLELIRKGATSRTIGRYIPGQWWYDSASALFLMTAVFGRTQWRYRFPRAYRSVLFEAGHACQTFCLAATWLGLAPFCTGRFADSFVERQLKIDGVTESFVYGAGVGCRPEGVTWAPWPTDASATHPLMRRATSESE